MTALILEQQPAHDVNPLRKAGIEITPPIKPGYWTFRVRLTPTQALVAFPKFTTFGIGFEYETDWNTNLPYTCPPKEIYHHIKHNAGDPRIGRQMCLRAIAMLQQAIRQMRQQSISRRSYHDQE